ncbi:diguanylate cyclase (GGDEF)-like protein/PAS domain S-box-containing protein [Chromobacterium alkanivorans]|uniref:EAL domain-containing protein n=1 Tax=Chromobacterium alkanivorans TaxID=1071719 RepID=UPI0021670FB5|nr:diguanylate cyclase (GGDEF)-like protein/PAS domain S-box-containing protein [Chromobacterium alkanivorans]MCS3818158.1 diguanylate cyclase (GGDEF)-like protein/PAS domain S-box-containing protein [Chromobacterium alkanivorans]MCS3874643.1 diguanylate cyclase (GGDEF)-like protein/PAS domain S-box-containing protein [Chromobacterium alkanivorans]
MAILQVRFESKLRAAITVAMVFVAILSLSIWKIVESASQAADWLANSVMVADQLAHIRGYTMNVEMSTQNYRLTGDKANLKERDRAIEARERLLAQVRTRIGDNPGQLDRWTALRGVVNQRLAISREVERLYRQYGSAAASAYAAQAPLRASRAQVYRLLDEMDQEEHHVLERRQVDYERSQQRLLWWNGLSGITLYLLLGGTYFMVRRQWRALSASRAALASSEENLAATLHSIGDAVVSVNAAGLVTRCNRIAELLTGWPAAEAVGLPLSQILTVRRDKDDRAIDLLACGTRMVTQSLHMPESWHGELVARDGRQCPISYTVAPIIASGGLLNGVVVVFRDSTAERDARLTILAQNTLLTERVQDQTSRWRESEAHLHAILSSVPVLIAYVNADRLYVYVNEQYRLRFAPERASITGCAVSEILGAERYAVACPYIDQALSGEPLSYDWQPFPGIWQNIRYVPKHNEQAEVIGYYVLGIDVTERKAAEEHIQLLNSELLQQVSELEHVSRALRTLSAGNRAMLRARDEPQLLDSSCRAIVEAGGYSMAVIWYGDGDAQTLRPMAQCGFAGGLDELKSIVLGRADAAGGISITPTAVRTGKVQLARDMQNDSRYEALRALLHGAASGLACPLQVDGRVIGALTIYDRQADTFDDDEIDLLIEASADLAFGIGTLRAQREREQARVAMQQMLRHDQLTGLPNMLQFEEALTLAIVHASQEGRVLAVLQFNIERLGEINEVLGFAQGDQVLCEFGARLKDCLPAAALAARVRGDEFAVLLPDADAQEALVLVTAVTWTMASAFEVAGLTLDVAARVGIALFPQHGGNVHDLLRHMGKAAQQAKQRGVAYYVYEPGKGETQAERLMLARELRRAIGQGELRLYLQPKVCLADAQVCGAEALVRWQHPQHGLLAPGAFIDIAERSGLIHPLTEWVITATLELLQAWQRQQLMLPIAVNLSARNLQDDALPDKLRLWQEQRSIPTGLLELEITESSVMLDPESALALLHELRCAGVALYVDDFGTGYSSLSYLQKLPVDYIKIDQSFVMNMSQDKDSAMIVKSTIELVHHLGRQVVAEGVESAADWQSLRELGCDYAQGYFIAAPMPAEQFAAWTATFRAP